MAALSADSDGFDDFDLVARLKQGDQAAWTRVVFDEQARIYRLAYRLVGPGDAEDVTQETFRAALEKIAQFNGEAKFSTWLYRIGLNQCRLTHRRRKRDADKMKALAKENPPSSAGQAPAETNGLTPAELELVRDAFDRLDEKSRLVLTLKYFEGLSYEQIGAELGWSSKATVAKKVWKAEERMRELLSQRRGGGC